jgi:hypothetical protein
MEGQYHNTKIFTQKPGAFVAALAAIVKLGRFLMPLQFHRTGNVAFR